MNQRSQHKTRYNELDKKKMGHPLELLGTGKDFLNRKLLSQAWDFINLKHLCTKHTIIQTK